MRWLLLLALLARGTQRGHGVRHAKWVLVTADSASAFLALSWDEDAPTDLFEGLAFTLALPFDLPDRQRPGWRVAPSLP